MSDPRFSQPRTPVPPRAGAGGLHIRVGGATPQQAAAQRGDAREAWLAELRQCMALYEKHREALSERLLMLKFALHAQGLPQQRRDAMFARMRPDHRLLAEAVLVRMGIDRELVKRVSLAVTRFDAVGAAFKEVGALLARAESEPEAVDPTFHGMPQVPQLKGHIYSLTTFDLMFRDDPVLDQLFPLQARKATGSLEGMATPQPPRPQAPRPEAQQAAPQRGTGALGNMLGGLVKRIKGDEERK